ncbi:MAG: hypothetical protein Sylvanvirus33_3 [Sylvanvirus sp.]|uniref:Uncharacterized protein n=1 Tax=Sylvanvirus sp. TaxID=2487774 RepID=A0A3G5AJ25_9VIRU|nr:MAG: hypothetical protein Sylvanvirus33_3 [Sylvanvirus sp.]
MTDYEYQGLLTSIHLLEEELERLEAYLDAKTLTRCITQCRSQLGYLNNIRDTMESYLNRVSSSIPQQRRMRARRRGK